MGLSQHIKHIFIFRKQYSNIYLISIYKYIHKLNSTKESPIPKIQQRTQKVRTEKQNTSN